MIKIIMAYVVVFFSLSGLCEKVWAFSRAYKINVIVDVVSVPAKDASTRKKALEFIQNIKKITPFKELIAGGFVEISDEPKMVKLNCRGGKMGIDRLPQCDFPENDSPELEKLINDANICPIFTSFPNVGGGGDIFPIASTTLPWTTMLHEIGHSLGLADDYAYTKEEAKKYCEEWGKASNVYSDFQMEKKYSSKEAAEEACRKNIPWCSEVTIPVTFRGKDNFYHIGSPPPASCPSNLLGVYLGGNCQAINPSTTWRPIFCPTIMGYPDLGEEHCDTLHRQTLISGFPNLIPTYYRQAIVKRIEEEILQGPINLTWADPKVEPCFPGYGIPSVDCLKNNVLKTLYDGCKLPMPETN
jgi:hypothetical protein